MTVKAGVFEVHKNKEILTEEHCHIIQTIGLPSEGRFSIARARVEAGQTTAWHKLIGITEIYLIFSGRGLVEVGKLAPKKVGPGNLVMIPPGTRQRITAIGKKDLIFFCICCPSFTVDCYRSIK